MLEKNQQLRRALRNGANRVNCSGGFDAKYGGGRVATGAVAGLALIVAYLNHDEIAAAVVRDAQEYVTALRVGGDNDVFLASLALGNSFGATGLPDSVALRITEILYEGSSR